MLNIDYDHDQGDERQDDLRPAEGCVWLAVASAVLWGVFAYFMFLTVSR